MFLNPRKYPRGPFLVLAIFKSVHTPALEQQVFDLDSDYQLYLQDSGMGWSAVVLSLHEVMRSEWTIREMLNDPNSRAQIVFETNRVMNCLNQHKTLISLQFPTICDLMCSIHRLILSNMPRFEKIYPDIENRLEYDISIDDFAPATIANDDKGGALVPFGEAASKKQHILNLCETALKQYLVWHEIKNDAKKGKDNRKIVCLLNNTEKNSIEKKIQQLGSAAGIVGLSIALSKPRQPSSYLQSYTVKPKKILQDNSKYPLLLEDQAIAT